MGQTEADNSSPWLICVSYLNIFRFLCYVFPDNNFFLTVNQNIDQFLNLDETSVTKKKELVDSKSDQLQYIFALD